MHRCTGGGVGGGAEPLGEESQSWRVLIKLSAKISGDDARGAGCGHQLGRPATVLSAAQRSVDPLPGPTAACPAGPLSPLPCLCGVHSPLPEGWRWPQAWGPGRTVQVARVDRQVHAVSLSVHLVYGMRQLEGERSRHGKRGIRVVGWIVSRRTGRTRWQLVSPWVSLVPCGSAVRCPICLRGLGRWPHRRLAPLRRLTHPRNENCAGVAADKLAIALIRGGGAGTLAALWGAAAGGVAGWSAMAGVGRYTGVEWVLLSV